MRLAAPLAALTLAACTLAALASEAAAQGHAVVACRDRNMNLVTCESGGGGGGTTDYSNAGGMGGLGYAVGYGIGMFFRSLLDPGMYADPAAQAAAERDAQRIQQAAYERAVFLAEQERRHQDTAAQQAAFASQQRDLVGMIRPMGGEPGAGVALPQLRAIELGVRDIAAQPPEAAAAAAGQGFDSRGATLLPSGPLMQVQGVPRVDANAPPPQAPGVDPALQPMTMDQRALVAEGRERQRKLDVLRAKKAKGEIDATAADAEEAALLDSLNALAARFAALTPPGAPGRLANLVGAADVKSCMVADPATIGCIEVRNATEQRMRVYIRELPGVFCTIEPGSYCSRPVTAGRYLGYAELENGRRTADATLDLKPTGVRWQVGAQ